MVSAIKKKVGRLICVEIWVVAAKSMAELDSLKKGRISQIQAEYFRGVVRRNSSSMAIKEMNEGIRNDMQSIKERLTVAERAKSKVNQVIDNLKR